MPKRKIPTSNGGASISEMNELHALLIKGAQTTIRHELETDGFLKSATISAIRQLCTDAGIQPSIEIADEFSALSAVLPTIDVDYINNRLNR